MGDRGPGGQAGRGAVGGEELTRSERSKEDLKAFSDLGIKDLRLVISGFQVSVRQPVIHVAKSWVRVWSLEIQGFGLWS